MTALPNKELLRPDEVADYFSLKVKTIYGWIATGKLDALKIHGSIRIRRVDVEKIAEPVIH